MMLMIHTGAAMSQAAHSDNLYCQDLLALRAGSDVITTAGWTLMGDVNRHV